MTTHTPLVALSATESFDTNGPALDAIDSAALVAALAQDHAQAIAVVVAQQAALGRAVDAAALRLREGGRLVYVGAGTSGRLGLLDSVELVPTFSWPPERSVALLAGGDRAVYVAVEGAEDSERLAQDDVARVNVNRADVVIALAASGTTPYVIAAVTQAKQRGALTIAFANNPNAPLCAAADIGITLNTGAEMLSGSTRLKAGTAQKVALNTFSTALMVRLHKTYGNLMVDVRATNKKLVARATRLTQAVAQCDEATAQAALAQCDHHVKTAAVMIVLRCSAAEATEKLLAHNGALRACLSERAT